MSEVTLEKTYALLEKLAGYVMEKIPKIEQRLEEKADKKDVERFEKKMDALLDGMDKQAGQLDIIRTEQKAFNNAINRIENRVEKLEKVH